MTAAEPNGLASLSAQRERARRAMPPPRHPVPPVREGDDASRPRAAQQLVEGEATGSGQAAPRPSTKSTPAPQLTGTTGATFKVTLYVDRVTDEFMESARVEGLTSRPKVDVSRSAVVRLALRRLMKDMTPAEVKVLLEGQVVPSSGPGRKRR